MNKLIRSFFVFLNICIAGAILLSYVSPFISPAKTYVFSFFGLAYPFFLILNILFILFWLLTRKRNVLISLFAILIGFGYTNSFVGCHNSKEKTEVHKEIRVLSFNTQSFQKLKKRSGEIITLEKEKFVDFLESKGLHHIICTQETSYRGQNLIKEDLEYPFTHYGKGRGVVIFSREKIIDQGEIELQSDKASSAIWADINIDSITYRIYNIHLQSNRISRSTEKMIQDGDLQSSKTWKSIRGILANYKNSTIVRAKQAHIISSHIASSPYPVIICGDFNDTPLSYVYQTIAKNKKDSFKIKGKGIGTTYAGVIPALRIDYILADERLDIADHQIFKENYSDHYPISVRIVLP